MKQVKFSIEGMGCEGCARKIAWFLEQAGAQEVKVSRMTSEAVFLIPEDKPLKHYVHIVENAGHYRVVAIQEGSR